MEGMILAAGLGTRLRPLTNDRPKALVEVNGHTLLEMCIVRMAAVGVDHCVVNVHHFGEMMIEYIQSTTWPCRVTISDERGLLLDTGGALKQASPLFDGQDTVLIHNVDVLSDIDLQDVAKRHNEEGNLVTLCVSKRETKRMLLFDEQGMLLGRGETTTPPNGETPLAFSGITAVNPKLFGMLPKADYAYPIIDEYIRLAHEGNRIGSYIHPAERWLDVGKPETLAQAVNFLDSNMLGRKRDHRR